MQMKAGETILSRGLPKTGQTYQYQAGGDGTYQAGWWQGLKIADNKTRFIAKTIDGDDVVIDNATGLMWAADGNAAGCNNGNAIGWSAAIIYGNALDFAGFTDWRIPNINELVSIVNWSLYAQMIDEPPFVNTKAGYYWPSTTSIIDTDSAFAISFVAGLLTTKAKTGTYYIRCVRGGV